MTPRAAAHVTVAALLLSFPASAVAAPSPTEELFARKCASCHTIGGGPRVGPDLKGAHQKRTRAWLEAFVLAPSTKLDSDPDARQLLAEFKGVRMPDLGLSTEQTRALVDLIARCSGEPCELGGRVTPVTQAKEADAVRGADLFTGRQALSGGGAPCLSCHTAQGAGAGIVGGRLARDLTHAFARLGDEGLDAALKNPAFPVMNKVFATHPLSAEEVFALRAFLARANKSDRAGERGLEPVLPALLGTAVALVALDAAWRRRLRGVRRPLTRRNGS
jgi:mono/diheme cytochrome c family protein